MARLIATSASPSAGTVSSPKVGLYVSRTPLRISFAGGGTDLPDFFRREGGAVLSTAIDKYVYVTVKRHGTLFGEKYRLNYSQTEHVHLLGDMQNEIARECIRLLDPEPPVYISTVADLPASSGLGSSSSFAVGLLNALHAFRSERVSAAQLAEEACKIEIDVLNHPIGKQDQYAAAFGGLNFFSFRQDGGVTLEPQNLPAEAMERLTSHMLLFYTGIVRNSSTVLQEQKQNIAGKMDFLRVMRGHADELRRLLRDGFDPLELGRILNETWQLKRQLASTITSPQIDRWYAAATGAGARGGKILGAGGGGFLLLVARPENHGRVRRALGGLTEIPVGYESQGSRMLLPSVE